MLGYGSCVAITLLRTAWRSVIAAQDEEGWCYTALLQHRIPMTVPPSGSGPARSRLRANRAPTSHRSGPRPKFFQLPAWDRSGLRTWVRPGPAQPRAKVRPGPGPRSGQAPGLDSARPRPAPNWVRPAPGQGPGPGPGPVRVRQALAPDASRLGLIRRADAVGLGSCTETAPAAAVGRRRGQDQVDEHGTTDDHGCHGER